MNFQQLLRQQTYGGFIDALMRDEGNILRKMCRDVRLRGKTLAGTPEFRRLREYRRLRDKIGMPDRRPIFDEVTGVRMQLPLYPDAQLVHWRRPPVQVFFDECTVISEDDWAKRKEWKFKQEGKGADG